MGEELGVVYSDPTPLTGNEASAGFSLPARGKSHSLPISGNREIQDLGMLVAMYEQAACLTPFMIV